MMELVVASYNALIILLQITYREFAITTQRTALFHAGTTKPTVRAIDGEIHTIIAAPIYAQLLLGIHMETTSLKHAPLIAQSIPTLIASLAKGHALMFVQATITAKEWLTPVRSISIMCLTIAMGTTLHRGV